jgi:DNA-binding transcriptional ArsR family regulator
MVSVAIARDTQMVETDRRTENGVRKPTPPLPDDSGLTLEEYLAMQQAIGHPTRFRILRTLTANDELSATDLKSAVDVEPHNFHYHLDELVDVGLVDKRQRRTADSQGFYTYYRPTAMGRGILEYGVEELMRREREFNEAYS